MYNFTKISVTGVVSQRKTHRSKFQTAQVERGLMDFPWLGKPTQLLSVEEKVRLILER